MIIYLITNNINGKKYIGQTVQSVETRFYQHCRDKRSGSTVSKAITKYGKDNFTIEIIDTADSFLELNIKEEYWICSLDLVKKGYNSRTGGRDGRHTEQSRAKMSKSHTGKVLNKSHRQAISKGMQTSKKAIKADKGKYFRENNPQYDIELKSKIARSKYKPVYCVNNKLCYLSLKLASEDLDIKQNSMSTAMTRGNRIHGYKFYYIYTKIS